MTSVWTWGGTYFGSLDGDDLWTHDGKHVGKLRGEEIFGQDGQYLGEIKNDDRLIANLSKKSLHGPSFMPYANRVVCKLCRVCNVCWLRRLSSSRYILSNLTNAGSNRHFASLRPGSTTLALAGKQVIE